MGSKISSWAHAHDSFAPAQYAPLALTHVRYLPDDPLSVPLAIVTLSPILLLVAYTSVLMIRRELTILFALAGQLACEALNLLLKRTFKQARPTDFLGTGYGMPSSHSQFVGYFAAFWTLHLLRNRPGMSQRARAAQKGSSKRQAVSLISLIRLTEHFALLALILVGCLATAYSRYHLSYHTPLQIIVGVGLGIACGAAWYVVCEILMSQRLFGHSRSIRHWLLSNPILVALRVRDSWAVWDDGGIEAEYALWLQSWTRLQQEHAGELDATTRRGQKSRDGSTDEDVEHMILALSLADKCDETTTAFSVGCVITEEATGTVVATGYSREEPGNTHAEEVALNKLSRRQHQRGGDDGAHRKGDTYLTLYTTMEPCSERLSKKDACVQRIVGFNAANVTDPGSGRRLVIRRIVQGVREPDDFVQCTGTQTLQEQGLVVVHLRPSTEFVRRSLQKDESHPKQSEVLRLDHGWLEREAVRIAKHGHADQPAVNGHEDRVWREADWIPLRADGEARRVLSDKSATEGLRKRGTKG